MGVRGTMSLPYKAARWYLYSARDFESKVYYHAFLHLQCCGISRSFWTDINIHLSVVQMSSTTSFIAFFHGGVQGKCKEIVDFFHGFFSIRKSNTLKPLDETNFHSLHRSYVVFNHMFSVYFAPWNFNDNLLSLCHAFFSIQHGNK